MMKSVISKSPVVPTELSSEEIAFLTSVTFGSVIQPRKCDVLFVFSGTHPGHWEKAIEAYHKGFAPKIVVTGGRSLTGTAHPDWNGKTEAQVIIDRLIEAGIPEEIIVFEDQSTNTLENVLFAKKVFDFKQVNTVMFICKSHATGRQYRTLAQHLPEGIAYIPYTFDASYQGNPVSRENWMTFEEGKRRVWGEYLRILHYGEKGDILPLEK